MDKLLHALYGLTQQIFRLNPYPKIVVKVVCVGCSSKCVRAEIESVYRSPEMAIEDVKDEFFKNHPYNSRNDTVFVIDGDEEDVEVDIEYEDDDDEEDYEEYIDEEEVFDDDEDD